MIVNDYKLLFSMKTNSIQKYSDNELHLLIQKKNKTAFTLLYEYYGSMIYGLAVHALKSKELADEIVELTFMKVWDSIHLFKLQKKTFCMWLVGLFIATAQDYLESKNIEFVFKNSGFPSFTFEIIGEKAC